MHARESTRYEEHRRSAIRAAAAVFADKGFHGATTTDIATRMGIKQGSLYYYFKNKEEALFEVCMLGIRDYVRNMEEIAAGSQPFEAKLLATVASHLSRYREKNEALKVHNNERLYLPAKYRRQLKAQGSRYRTLLEGILADAIEQGVVRHTVDSHFAALSIIGLCNSWGEHIVRDPELDLFATVQRCTDLILGGLTAARH